MIMKKLLLTLALCFCALTASAQNIAVGGRIGSGLQIQGEFQFNNDNYVESRFGMSWLSGGGLTVDCTLLYQWEIAKFNLTPGYGEWFVDAGAGVNVGGKAHYAYVGVAGCAKFGIKLKDLPIKVAIDWTPIFGPEIAYYKKYRASDFYGRGLANFALSCVYCF